VERDANKTDGVECDELGCAILPEYPLEPAVASSRYDCLDYDDQLVKDDRQDRK